MPEIARGVIIAGVAAPALAGCASSATTTSNPPASSPAASTPAALAFTSPPPGTAGMICADLEALAIAGNSSNPIAAVASTVRVTQAQVVGAIDSTCPKMASLESE
jgi:hypothetical protein